MEFLLEVADQIGGLPAIISALAHYESRLTPELLHALGGDRLVHFTLREVPPNERGT
jgi:hypothetical protein